ncbi:hypothetical protein P3S67_015046 [Capsicum chacoense]
MSTFHRHLPCNNETGANTMDQRLPVNAITPETTDWTCKIQVVDKFRPHKSNDSSVHFQTILVQDESEHQVSKILYGDDIPKYENLFGLFETYLVSCVKVREPRSYSIRAATYEWVADRYTILEEVTYNNGSEAPLSSSIKLDTLSFSAIEEQRPGVEFDLLAVVVNCSAIQYTTDQSKHFREAILIDQRCYFEVNIMDASDTITVMISETLGERMLSLTSEQIYEQVAVQQKPLCIARINQLLAHKLFTLQLQKPLFRFSDQKAENRPTHPSEKQMKLQKIDILYSALTASQSQQLTAHASRAKSSTTMKGFTKAKITTGHFSVFEIGSTSNAFTERNDPITSIIAKKVFLLCVLVGCSICWFNTVCYVLYIKHFPLFALSLSISFNSASAALCNLIVLRDWLELSLNHSVPSSLLILSRAFTVSGKVKPEEAIQATFSSLPDEVVDAVQVTSMPSEDSLAEKKRKLEFLEMDEKLIKEEDDIQSIVPGVTW